MTIDNIFMSIALVMAIKTNSQSNQIYCWFTPWVWKLWLMKQSLLQSQIYIHKMIWCKFLCMYVYKNVGQKTRHMRTLTNCAFDPNVQYYSLLLKIGWTPNMSSLKSYTQNIKFIVVSINGQGIMRTLFKYHDILCLI